MRCGAKGFVAINSRHSDVLHIQSFSPTPSSLVHLQGPSTGRQETVVRSGGRVYQSQRRRTEHSAESKAESVMEWRNQSQQWVCC